jgi:hypothetical protein
MKQLNYLWLFLLLFKGTQSPLPAAPQEENCFPVNATTRDNEVITYSVYYSLAGIYVNAGWAIFSNNLEQLDGRAVYHATGRGATHTNYDWIYKVRDQYETWMDTSVLRPLRFVRNVDEGGKKRTELISFNHAARIVTTDKGQQKVPACMLDVLSAIYFARNASLADFKPGDKIPFRMFLENKVHEIYIRFVGRETVKTKYGTFRAIKVKPLLVAGTLFKGGEDMTVWVTDDANRLPVRIESPIVVGSIKVDMMKFQNLKYPLTALIKK